MVCKIVLLFKVKPLDFLNLFNVNFFQSFDSEIISYIVYPLGKISISLRSITTTSVFTIFTLGMCRTNTWQYATKNDLHTTSYWVGIERGCQEDQTTAQTNVVTYTNIWREDGDGFTHGTNRGADKMEKFVRYYIASNTASKAKDLAKYPDSGTLTGSNVGIIPFAFGNGKGTRLGNLRFLGKIRSIKP